MSKNLKSGNIRWTWQPKIWNNRQIPENRNLWNNRPNKKSCSLHPLKHSRRQRKKNNKRLYPFSLCCPRFIKRISNPDQTCKKNRISNPRRLFSANSRNRYSQAEIRSVYKLPPKQKIKVNKYLILLSKPQRLQASVFERRSISWQLRKRLDLF